MRNFPVPLRSFGAGRLFRNLLHFLLTDTVSQGGMAALAAVPPFLQSLAIFRWERYNLGCTLAI
ncbi:hypothetical protein GCWU000341_02581 [Oribacterium sp. oral taxon 078 str. F0262]|nr:hypothetical protein GCWU000341_02581 [Oribacterium sp. oral taxon 078 str. F0262]